MPLSYKVIKRHQVTITEEDFKIPTTTAKNPKETGNEETFVDIKRKEIHQKAQKLIQNAEHRAKLIIDEAQEQAKDIQQRAQNHGYNQGFKTGQEEGYQAGYAAALEEIHKIKEHAKELLTTAHQESREYIQRTREEIIDLSISIAKNIIHYSIDKNDENITEIIKNALEKSEESKQIILRSHPKYIPILKNNIDEFGK